MKKFDYIKFVTEHKHGLEEMGISHDDASGSFNIRLKPKNRPEDVFAYAEPKSKSVFQKRKNAPDYVKGIPVYYSFKSNRSDTTNLIRKLKKGISTLSEKDLLLFKGGIMNRLPVFETTQKGDARKTFSKPDILIVPESTSDLLELVKEVAIQKYKFKPNEVITSSKLLYNTPEDMINWDVFKNINEWNQNNVMNMIKCLKKSDIQPPYIIKKSGWDGKCGLQGGAARDALNPTMKVNTTNLPDNLFNKYLIIDDTMISGGTIIDQIIDIVGSQGKEAASRITGYVVIKK